MLNVRRIARIRRSTGSALSQGRAEIEPVRVNVARRRAALPPRRVAGTVRPVVPPPRGGRRLLPRPPAASLVLRRSSRRPHTLQREARRPTPLTGRPIATVATSGSRRSGPGATRTVKAMPKSSTRRAIGPGWTHSRGRTQGNAPCRYTPRIVSRPPVGLSPWIPQQWQGWRMLPPGVGAQAKGRPTRGYECRFAAAGPAR